MSTWCTGNMFLTDMLLTMKTIPYLRVHVGMKIVGYDTSRTVGIIIRKGTSAVPQCAIFHKNYPKIYVWEGRNDTQK